jgi:hypothetical protein
MDCVELLPSLDHCIESIAREEFWHSVSQYTEDGRGDKELEKKIQLLKAFLEAVDFGKLRSQSEKHLVEGNRVKFVICRKEGELHYEMVVTEEKSPESY